MIRDKIQQKVGKAFNDKLTDAVITFTCTKEVQSGEYDWETQTYPTQTTQAYTGRGVLGSYLRDLVKPTDYQVDDGSLLVLQNEITAPPQIDDVLLLAIGQFKVINIGKDPADATYKMQIRKIGEPYVAVKGLFPSKRLVPSKTLYPRSK